MIETIVIGICGKKGSGKDTLANYIMKSLSSKVFSTKFHFADAIKESCVLLFGLDPKFIYGRDEDKNAHTHFMWENWPCINKPSGKQGPMTHREFLQSFGTDFCRHIKKDIHIDNLLKRIYNKSIFEDDAPMPFMALIADMRFQNEADAIKIIGGINILLTKGVDTDNHISENNIFFPDSIDLIIHNDNMTKEEQANIAVKFISEKLKL